MYNPCLPTTSMAEVERHPTCLTEGITTFHAQVQLGFPVSPQRVKKVQRADARLLKSVSHRVEEANIAYFIK